MFAFPAHGPNLEALTAVPALEAFAQRQTAVADTIEEHKLHKGAVLIGSAGLAVHGINVHVGSNDGTSKFDVDVVVDNPTFAYLQNQEGATNLPARMPSEVHLPGTDSVLPVSALKTPLTGDLAERFRVSTFNDLCVKAIPVSGVLTLTPAELAHTKIGRGQLKDLAGILMGHLVAWEMGHPIVEDEAWQRSAILARNHVELRADSSNKTRRALPRWLGSLVASDFDHPAFTRLQYEPMAFRRIC